MEGSSNELKLKRVDSDVDHDDIVSPDDIPGINHPKDYPLSPSTSISSSTASLQTSETATSSSNIQESVSENKLGSESQSSTSDSSNANRITLRRELSPSDFFFGATLGEGAYARVVHARIKKPSNIPDYAVKIMEKAHIKKENKVKYVMTEKTILSRVSHNFIIKFHFSFQDSLYLYMCMDLAPGGELLSIITEYKRLNESKGILSCACSEEMACFYSAELIEALEYLHSQYILHRDIKPENILISRDGHLKLTDFGTALILDPNSPSPLSTDDDNSRSSFVGTAEYVSPEVLRNEDVTHGCDMWAVGCVIYQMLVGNTPFVGASEYLIFQSILDHASEARPITYPDCLSISARDLIDKLLISNQNERLGVAFSSVDSLKDLATSSELLKPDDEKIDNIDRSVQQSSSQSGNNILSVDQIKHGYSQLKSHQFYANIPWDSLHHLTAPFQPNPRTFPNPSLLRDGADEDWILDGEATPILPETGRRNSSEGLPISGQSHDYTSTLEYKLSIIDRPSQHFIRDTPRLSSFFGLRGTNLNLKNNNSKMLADVSIFLNPDEKNVFTGIVSKRVGLFSKRRQLILSDQPRLIYFDTDTLEVKGTIPWTPEHPVRCELVNETTLDVISTKSGRRYHLKAEESGSQMWFDLINAMLLKQREQMQLQSGSPKAV